MKGFLSGLVIVLFIAVTVNHYLTIAMAMSIIKGGKSNKTVRRRNAMGTKLLEETKQTGVFADKNKRPDGRRKINLTRPERHALARQSMIEAAAALFLDIDTHRTWAQIAETLEITVPQLRTLTRTDEFNDAYNELIPDVGHDPRFKSAQLAITDMLSLAVMEHNKVLKNDSVAPGVKMKAVELAYKITGMKGPEQSVTEREQLAKFLKDAGIGAKNADVEDEFDGSMEKFFGPNVMEGEFHDVDPQGGEEDEATVEVTAS